MGSHAHTEHLSAYYSAGVNTSLRHPRLALLTAKLPPLKDRGYQGFRDSSDVPQPATELPALPSISSFFSSEEIQEPAPASRDDLQIRSSDPALTYSSEQYAAPVAESDTLDRHPRDSAPYYPGSFATSRIAPTGPGNGSAPTPGPSIMNSHARRIVNASGTCQSFPGLVTELIEHPILPVLVKKVFEVCTGHEVNVPNCAINLSTAESDASIVKNFAHSYGIEEACGRWSPADVYLNSCLCALQELKKRSLGVYVPPTLQDTINACRYVAVGDSRRETNTAALSRESGLIGGLSSFVGHKHLVSVRPVPVSSTKALTVGSRKPPRPSPDSIADMEDWYLRNIEHAFPTKEEKHMFKNKWGISYKQVNNFFNNRRSRPKNEFESILKNRKYRNQRDRTPGSKHGLVPSYKIQRTCVCKKPNPTVTSGSGNADVAHEIVIGRTHNAPRHPVPYEE